MESILAEPMRSEPTPITERDFVPLFGQIAIGKPRVFTMFAIFDFAAEYDLSAALTELRAAIRLCDGRGRNGLLSARPRKSTSSRMLRCTLHFGNGSKARITAPQHCCPLHPQ
jgi:hypothetical protein